MAQKNQTTGQQRRGRAATKPSKVIIRNLPTGIPGLDAIMGGGLPEFSFNIVAGGPGCGKTTMAHQFVFANATEQRPGLYFTILGESLHPYPGQYTVEEAYFRAAFAEIVHAEWGTIALPAIR